MTGCPGEHINVVYLTLSIFAGSLHAFCALTWLSLSHPVRNTAHHLCLQLAIYTITFYYDDCIVVKNRLSRCANPAISATDPHSQC